MKLGLCLSGGGIKGAAHIGAIKAFEEEKINFDAIAGTSSGSIVACLLASGYSSNEIYELFKKYAKDTKNIDWKNILKIVHGAVFKRKLTVSGLNSGEVIEKTVNKACNLKNIYNLSDIRKELLIPAIDSESGKVYVFNSCKLNHETNEEKFITEVPIGKAVRASCSYPVVFSPCPYQNKNLLDGGIKENIPWKELKVIGCDKVLSIDFENLNKKKCCDSLIDVASRSLELVNEELRRHEINEIDFLLTIKLQNVSLLEIEKLQEVYEEGYKQTKENMKKIKEFLK